MKNRKVKFKRLAINNALKQLKSFSKSFRRISQKLYDINCEGLDSCQILPF